MVSCGNSDFLKDKQMSSPATPSPLGDIAESVTFVLRAINGANNVLFNRKETLTVPTGTESSIQDGLVISDSGTSIITPVALNGIFIFNIDDTAILTIVGIDSGFSGNITLNPFGAVCIFNPTNPTGFEIVITSSVNGSQATVVFWA